MIFSPAETLPVILTMRPLGYPPVLAQRFHHAPVQVKHAARKAYFIDDFGECNRMFGVNSLGLMTMVLPVKRAGAFCGQ